MQFAGGGFASAPSSDTFVLTNATNQPTANPFPQLLSVVPNNGSLGQTVAAILTGACTSFAPGTTTATFGAGITIPSLAVNSPVSATAVVTTDPTAALGARTVTITTGSEVVSLANGFTVNASTLTHISPNTGKQGQQNLSVGLTGQFTNWVQGKTTASFGAEITVASLTVTSSTSATAVLNIDPTASVGARTLTLTTGNEIDILTNGFSVTAGIPVPVLLAVIPNSGQQGQQNLSAAITGQFTHWVQGTTTHGQLRCRNHSGVSDSEFGHECDGDLEH